MLHLENRTRFPDLQDAAGAFNSKRAYLGVALAERLGIRQWASESHVIVGLWSAEVLHALRIRPESFRSLCPDRPDRFTEWWSGQPPTDGISASPILLDPLASRRQRPFIGLDEAIDRARPRYRGYADAARMLGEGQRRI